MPLTAMEAQSCGTPVVAFNIGGLSDIVVDDETGILVNAEDVKEFGNAVSSLLSDHSRRVKFSVQAQSHAESTWSPAVVTAQYVDIYSELLNQSGS